MKLLLIDHEFHKKTASSDFFIDILRQRHEVEIVYFDPDSVSAESIRAFEDSICWADYDLAIVWQLEVLGIMANAHGLPSLLIPMFDGSAGLPDDVWSIHQDSSILHFSYNFYMRTLGIVRAQKWVQYFPNPDRYNICRDSSRQRVFYWLRRPEELNINSVFRLVRGGFERFHIHVALDDPKQKSKIEEWEGLYGVTTSTWFDSKQEYEDLLDQFNVFVCPRISEGIGMAMLDALARGMCVIACREPTHTEYIADGINGYLFDQGSYHPLGLSSASRLRRMARRGVEKGWEKWQSSIPEIHELVEQTSTFEVQSAVDKDTARSLIREYFDDIDTYVESVRQISAPEEYFGGGSARLGGARVFFRKSPVWQKTKKFIPVSVRQLVGRAIRALPS